MTNIEKKIIENIIGKRDKVFFFVVLILGLILRYSGRRFLSLDMEMCLLPWFDSMKKLGGLAALRTQVGDYNLFYQTIIAVMTYLPFNAMYVYKIISIIFDLVLSLLCSFVSTKMLNKEFKISKIFTITFFIVFLLPTVVLNSSFWGQCDSIYCFILIVFLYLFYLKEYKKAFLIYGLAISCKLQAIFMLPFIVIIYFVRKDFSIMYFILSLLSFWVTGLVAYFNGRNIFDCFAIYVHQSNEYQFMYENYPNFWAIFNVYEKYSSLKYFAIIITFAILGIGLYQIISEKNGYKFESLLSLLKLSIWSVWTCVMFLPAMHERYGYFVSIAFALVSLVDKKYFKIMLLMEVITLITYLRFLFSININSYFLILAVANFYIYVCFSKNFFLEKWS